MGVVTPALAVQYVAPLTTTVKVSSKIRTIKVAKGFNVANLYKINNTESVVLMSFKGGEKVTEIETKGSMMKVKFGKLTGWIVLR